MNTSTQDDQCATPESIAQDRVRDALIFAAQRRMHALWKQLETDREIVMSRQWVPFKGSM